MPHFLVLGRLGIQLSDPGPFQIGDMRIGTKPPQSASKTPSPRLASTFAADVVTVAPELNIRTNASFWCSVVADSHLDAIRTVKNGQMIVLRHALSRELQRIVDIETTWAYPTDGSPGSGDASAAVRVTPLAPIDLHSAEVDEEFRAVDADERCLGACRHLDRARALAESAAYLGAPAGDAAILEYAKALEYLATDVRFRRSTPERDDSQERVIEDLMAGITRARSTKQRVKAVMSTGDQLRRLDRKFLDQRVSILAETLGLSDDWLRLARRLLKARNSKAAHPGDPLSGDERSQLLNGTKVGGWQSSVDWMLGEAIARTARLE